MNYEYNGNLLEEDRINLVANEIIKKYPQIDINKAKEISMLEGKISTYKNLEMQFNRLYNIMLVLKDNKSIVKTIYLDIIDLLSKNKSDHNIDYYYSISIKITDYLMNNGNFPYLDEF